MEDPLLAWISLFLGPNSIFVSGKHFFHSCHFAPAVVLCIGVQYIMTLEVLERRMVTFGEVVERHDAALPEDDPRHETAKDLSLRSTVALSGRNTQ